MPLLRLDFESAPLFVCRRRSLAMVAAKEERKYCVNSRIVAGIVLLALFSLSQELFAVDFKSISEVRAKYRPKEREPTVWTGESSVTRQSSSVTTSTETRWHDATTGEYLYSDWSWVQNSTLCGGTIVALPNEDFQVKDTFSYIDSDGRTVVTGKFVSVTIGISSAGKEPSGTAKMRTVKNLCESGAAIPTSKGKAGRIVALKTAAKLRFGASVVDVYYNEHARSRVNFLLFKCNPSKARPEVKSIFYDGQSSQTKRK